MFHFENSPIEVLYLSERRLPRETYTLMTAGIAASDHAEELLHADGVEKTEGGLTHPPSYGKG
jgi:hypothetical protein